MVAPGGGGHGGKVMGLINADKPFSSIDSMQDVRQPVFASFKKFFEAFSAMGSVASLKSLAPGEIFKPPAGILSVDKNINLFGGKGAKR